jgi:hypothetical protein
MLSLQQLWDRLHLAQQEQNADAARFAIEAFNRCDHSKRGVLVPASSAVRIRDHAWNADQRVT